MTSVNFLYPPNFNGNFLRNAVLQTYPTNPVAPVVGQFGIFPGIGAGYYDGTDYVPFDARNLGPGSLPLSLLGTNPLSRANHTGVQSASTINDLKTTVVGYRRDEFADPTVAIDLNGQKIINLDTPAVGADAANKNYVDTAVANGLAGIDQKASVRIVTTTNITLSGLQTIQSVALALDDRVLVAGQTNAAQNGFYLAKPGAWVRSTDADGAGELTTGATTFVEEGAFAATLWRLNTIGAIDIGVTPLQFLEFQAAINYSAGNGILFTGSVISARLALDGGLETVGGELKVSAAIPRIKAFDIGNSVDTVFTVNHGLNNRDVVVQVRENAAPYDFVLVPSRPNTVNTVQVEFANAPGSAAYRVIVMGAQL